MEITVKYFDDSLPELGAIGGRSDWIDLYSRLNLFIPEGDFALIPLNVAMKLPKGYEAHVVPRSSTFKTWGLIQTNHCGIIDETYCGNLDEWKMPIYAVPGHCHEYAYRDESGALIVVGKRHMEVPTGCTPIRGAWISAGDRLCQFRIEEHMPPVDFVAVPRLDSEDRGGFGTTGR